jgi:hypothetical protein
MVSVDFANDQLERAAKAVIFVRHVDRQFLQVFGGKVRRINKP